MSHHHAAISSERKCSENTGQWEHRNSLFLGKPTGVMIFLLTLHLASTSSWNTQHCEKNPETTSVSLNYWKYFFPLTSGKDSLFPPKFIFPTLSMRTVPHKEDFLETRHGDWQKWFLFRQFICLLEMTFKVENCFKNAREWLSTKNDRVWAKKWFCFLWYKRFQFKTYMKYSNLRKKKHQTKNHQLGE